MGLNENALSDAQARGSKQATDRTVRLQAKWKQPTTEAFIGELWNQIRKDPQLSEYYKTNMPQVYKQMEAQYAQG